MENTWKIMCLVGLLWVMETGDKIHITIQNTHTLNLIDQEGRFQSTICIKFPSE